ncbi:HpcH/HpaI aldolase family protein [Sphingobium aquiterrae]|uniref:HpcH/HpaI aldolase family protein n=1 Tax=Sphingobium aquiterrae TaxID=2038656 RepID=UPI00301658B8
MLRPNALKARIARNQPSTGCWLFLGSPPAAELLSHVGFDALIVDMEHTPVGIAQVVDQMRAADRGSDGPTLMVRLPAADSMMTKPVLDAGAEGLFAPNVESADEAAALVASATYPPRGRRGLHYTVSRAAGWGAATADYPAHAASQLLTVAMIESEKGVAAIPEIAAVPGIDMLFLGPLDLSASIGVPGDYDCAAYRDLADEAERRTRESGIALGGTILPGLPAQALFDRGYAFVTVGADAGLLRSAALAALPKRDIVAS